MTEIPALQSSNCHPELDHCHPELDHCHPELDEGTEKHKDMEELIGLLIALAAVIFKAVITKLEKSGKKKPAPVASDEDLEGELDVKGWILEALEEADRETAGPVKPAEPAEPVKPVNYVKTGSRPKKSEAEPLRPAVKRNILKEDETSGKKVEKIDPRKLVIYSEIMKPKFKE